MPSLNIVDKPIKIVLLEHTILDDLNNQEKEVVQIRRMYTHQENMRENTAKLKN